MAKTGFSIIQDKGVYSRIVNIQPLCWAADGWPTVGENQDEYGARQTVQQFRLPMLPLTPCQLQASDDFPDGLAGRQWQ